MGNIFPSQKWESSSTRTRRPNQEQQHPKFYAICKSGYAWMHKLILQNEYDYFPILLYHV